MASTCFCAPSDPSENRDQNFWGSVQSRIFHLRLPAVAAVHHISILLVRIAAAHHNSETEARSATDEGAKVTTVAEGTDATAAPPVERKILLTVFVCSLRGQDARRREGGVGPRRGGVREDARDASLPIVVERGDADGVCDGDL